MGLIFIKIGVDTVKILLMRKFLQKKLALSKTVILERLTKNIGNNSERNKKVRTSTILLSGFTGVVAVASVFSPYVLIVGIPAVLLGIGFNGESNSKLEKDELEAKLHGAGHTIGHINAEAMYFYQTHNPNPPNIF